MYGRPQTSEPQQWSVHAEFRISHPGANDPENLPQTSSERDDSSGAVRMTYTWTANDNEERTASSDSVFGDGCPTNPPSTTFQKGNFFFTSTPPPRGGGGGKIGSSSGYGSDLLSPNSFGSTLPRRIVPPYNRKCKSTCNIVLSTNLGGCPHSQCGRTQSLRCQAPSGDYRDCPNRYYGCGDPWCHHPRSNDDFACSGRFSPVPELGEESYESTRRPSGASTFTVTDSSVGKRDASVQTFEMVDKCTSPFLRADSADKGVKKRYQRRKTEPLRPPAYSPSLSLTPDSLDSVKSTRSSKLRRLPAFTKPAKEMSPADSKTSDSQKKPRTVHIDVYCTGTEIESEASMSSEDYDSKSASTPQTVFESKQMKVTHQEAGKDKFPYHLQEKPSLDSDDDNASTSYPSKISSYSTIGDLSASISSVPKSWTTYSMSSCAVPDDYDSVLNTSWKDTFSDIDSLMHSKSSITQTESLDFVPKRLHKTESIDETPENLLQTPSSLSIQASDSFEYANSEDKLRIRKMEQLWEHKTQPKALKPPMSELQQKRMQEYMDRKIKSKPKWESKETESEDSDDSEKGWTFVKGPSRDTILRRPSKQPDLSPSCVALSERLSLDPNLRAPFTIVPGIYTEPRTIAKRFGTIVTAMKKPGHHVGPVRNPDCQCDHCQSYWEKIGYRNRTRSMGDPNEQYATRNWKDFLEKSKSQDFKRYTDF